MDKRKLFSKLPSVDEVLGDSKIVNIISEYPRDLVIEGIREAIDINRKSIINLKENINTKYKCIKEESMEENKCTNCVEKKLKTEIGEILKKYQRNKDNLIPIL